MPKCLSNVHCTLTAPSVSFPMHFQCLRWSMASRKCHVWHRLMSHRLISVNPFKPWRISDFLIFTWITTIQTPENVREWHRKFWRTLSHVAGCLPCSPLPSRRLVAWTWGALPAGGENHGSSRLQPVDCGNGRSHGTTLSHSGNRNTGFIVKIQPKLLYRPTGCAAIHGRIHINTDWSLYFRTTHGTKKMWSFIAGGIKIKVI